MARRENKAEVALRFSELHTLQDAFPRFLPFLDEVMFELGYPVSPLQADIADYLETGPHYLMIQAQRGQAKTTITAAYAIWFLIHNPRGRVLIVGADGGGAGDISKLIVQLINTMDILECMRPDRMQGDRTSNEKFDIHYSLKGIEKSASVMSLGITGTQQGKRADLLIADDIESTKNSLTNAMREMILDRSRDFSSQCVDGRIIYLGTPQTQDSIYNTLPSRGFSVRIWPGRYPTNAQLIKYGDMLAPIIRDAVLMDPSLQTGGGLLGDMGKPTDPTYITEAILQTKEQDQGISKFMLNHMLDTSLSDQLRFPLKLEQIMVARLSDKLPNTAHRRTDGTTVPHASHTLAFKLCQGIFGEDLVEPQGVVMYVDPAGGGANGDETAYAVTALVNSTVYVLAVGGIPGGYDTKQLDALADVARRFKPSEIVIEKNMGYGAFREVWLPVVTKVHACKVTDDYVTGQKERRIIDTLEPVIGRGALVFSEQVVEEDMKCNERYSAAHRTTYSLFHQISKITRDPKCLKHDDRVDALEGAVRHWVKYLTVDQDYQDTMAKDKALMDFFADPLGLGTKTPLSKNLFDKYRR